MKNKNVIKMILDIVMLGLLVLEYSKLYTGQLIHEIIGIVLLILFLTHNILNINFYKNLFKGKYTITRIITSFVDITFLICMLFTIILGIPISQKVFSFLKINGNMIINKLHIIFGYWSLIILSIHLGLHFKMIFTKMINKAKTNKMLRVILYIIQIIIVIYSIKAIIDTNLCDYLIGKASFSIPSNIFLSLFNNLSIVFAISIIVFQIQKILLKKEGNKNG